MSFLDRSAEEEFERRKPGAGDREQGSRRRPHQRQARRLLRA